MNRKTQSGNEVAALGPTFGALAPCVVDVCVCTFRQPRIAQTLHSLSRLTLAPHVSIRVIIADYDEESSAIEIVEAAARETGLRMTYLHVPAHNVSVARNACLDTVTAPLVAFIDDDKCAAPQWLSSLLTGMIGGNYAAVLGPVQAIYAPDCPAWIRAGDFHSTRPVWVDGKIVTGYTCNVLFSRTHPAFQDLRFRPDLGQTGGEDAAFFSTAVGAGARMGFAVGAIVTESVTPQQARPLWMLAQKFRFGQRQGSLLLDVHGRGLMVRVKRGVVEVAKVFFCFVACLPNVYRADRLAFWALRGVTHGGTLCRLFGKREITLHEQETHAPRHPILSAAEGDAMECRLIRDEAQMAELADGWRDLQARIGLAPFTDYDMARLWWQHIGKPSGAALLVAACFDQGKLVGVIPFSIRKKHGVRVLRLLGNEIFYYANFLTESPQVVENLWRAVLQDHSYDFANIKNIHNNTPEYAFFTARFRVFRASPAYYVAHSGKAREAMVAPLPKTLRRTIKRLDALIAAGDSIEIGMTTTQDIPADILAFLMNRKKAWAQEKGKTGIFDEANSTALFEAMIHSMAARGAVVLFWLREAGRPICATLGFIEKSVVYAHMVAFDQSAAKHSPGNYLTAQELIWASENGYGETNFMEGHDDYKAAFTKTARITNEFVVSRSWLGKIYYLLYKGLSLYRSSKKTDVA